MAYLYLDFDYSIENNRLTEVDIQIETTNYFDPNRNQRQKAGCVDAGT